MSVRTVTCDGCGSRIWSDCECHRCAWLAEFTQGFYVNVYEVHRCYGGPEEGGWWFDEGHPVRTGTPFDTLDEAEAEAERLREHYQDDGDRYSARGGLDYSVVIEPHQGRHYPDERPHYE